MKRNFVKAALTMSLASGLSISSWGIITSDTVGGGELNSVGFAVDFGSVSYVSDLSTGGLRFNRDSGTGGTQITTEDLEIGSESELSFDWMVVDQSYYTERALYKLIGLNVVADVEPITLHHGVGMGSASGSVTRLVGPGSYQLQVRTAWDPVNIGMYDFTLSNLQITPRLDVPDSSLGFLGIASILSLLGAHHRFAGSSR